MLPALNLPQRDVHALVRRDVSRSDVPPPKWDALDSFASMCRTEYPNAKR